MPKQSNHSSRQYRAKQQLALKLISEQDGRCAICQLPGMAQVVDHDHSTGIIRGMLCRNCNWGLGQFYDSPDLLRAAIVYLEGICSG